jgi:hypothetical protein
MVEDNDGRYNFDEVTWKAIMASRAGLSVIRNQGMPNMNGLSRRDLLKYSGGASLSGIAPFAGMDRARAEQGEQLLVVMWGAAWIEVCRKIVEAYTARTGDKVAWELHAGGAMAIVAKMKPLWPRVNYNSSRVGIRCSAR